MPMSAPTSQRPHDTRMDQQAAANHVFAAQELRRTGHAEDARLLLTKVLKDRPGYPPALAALAELELDRGQAMRAVRWARLAVRALPRSIENWRLLDRACAAAGLYTESDHAHEQMTELYLLKQ